MIYLFLYLLIITLLLHHKFRPRRVVCEEMLKTHFQDGRSGSHLGLSIDTILATFDLEVILLLQCKFKLKSAYGLGEVKNWFSSYYINNKLAMLHIEC